ncbi:hypothetical protein BKA56DRAFT_504318 [Ilyonectria sp. MPI-CAGE-AT-0026]|nr:hypothetical protein BKA56DRAFT_504318 [Ilyonectria sp. MPI-CAGE-AT-0026]
MYWFWHIWSLFLAILTLPAEVHSQLSELPVCALDCFQDVVASLSCSSTNETCICAELVGSANMTACVLGNCTVKESLTTQNITTTACNIAPRRASVSYNAIIITFTILSTILVAQRLAFRIYATIGLSTDDYLILLATLSNIPLTVLGVYGLNGNGLGQEVWTVPFESIYKFGKYFFVAALLYFLVMTLVKLALLFFYLRIFPFTPISQIIRGTIAFCILQGLIIIFVTIFLCQPISFFWEGWDGEHTGHCLSNRLIIWTNAIISIALDFWMLGIPLSQLRGLNLSRRKKLGVGAMFCVGAFVTVVSILRLSALVNFQASSGNATWNYFGASVWSVVETNVGILCTCMPTLRLFLVRYFPALSNSAQRSSFNAHAFSMPPGRNGNGQKGAVQSLSVYLNLDKTFKPGKVHDGGRDRMPAAGRAENDETELIHMREF